MENGKLEEKSEENMHGLINYTCGKTLENRCNSVLDCANRLEIEYICARLREFAIVCTNLSEIA